MVLLANVSGCTDATAANYDPAATVDDGSCCFDNFVACLLVADFTKSK